MGKLINRIPGLCLLISSLPGNALRTLVDIARLAERFNMRSQSIVSKDTHLVFSIFRVTYHTILGTKKSLLI